MRNCEASQCRTPHSRSHESRITNHKSVCHTKSQTTEDFNWFSTLDAMTNSVAVCPLWNAATTVTLEIELLLYGWMLNYILQVPSLRLRLRFKSSKKMQNKKHFVWIIKYPDWQNLRLFDSLYLCQLASQIPHSLKQKQQMGCIVRAIDASHLETASNHLCSDEWLTTRQQRSHSLIQSWIDFQVSLLDAVDHWLQKR